MTCSVLVVGMPSPAGCASAKTWRVAAELVFAGGKLNVSAIERTVAEALGAGVPVPPPVKEPVP